MLEPSSSPASRLTKRLWVRSAAGGTPTDNLPGGVGGVEVLAAGGAWCTPSVLLWRATAALRHMRGTVQHSIMAMASHDGAIMASH